MEWMRIMSEKKEEIGQKVSFPPDSTFLFWFPILKIFFCNRDLTWRVNIYGSAKKKLLKGERTIRQHNKNKNVFTDATEQELHCQKLDSIFSDFW